ncbi:amidase family protein, partial [Klebsiella pneumoniae]|nr:amidase family protein [Klebsiella pneumoniae]
EPGTFLAAAEREPGRLRIARFVEPVITDATVDPEVRRAWEDASLLLESLGHEVEDVPVPLGRDAVPFFEVCWSVLTALSPAP